MTLPRWQDNPALTREMRTRLRGGRAFGTLFAYLTILSLTLFLTYYLWRETRQFNGGATFQVGRIFFSTLFLIQAALVAVITPSLTAGGLTVEREQRTLEMLQVSLLSRFAIVWGKLLAAVGFVGLLIVSALPLFSLGFFFGGVAPDEVLVSCGLLLTTAFLYGAVGLGCSAICKSTTVATLATYAVLTVLFFVTLPFAAGGLAGTFGVTGARGGMGLAGLNPLGAMTAAGATDTYFGLKLPAWLTSGGMNLFLGLLCAIAAGHRLEYPRSDRSGLLRLLTGVYILLLSFGFYHFAFVGLRAIGGGADEGGRFAAIAAVLALAVLIPIFVTGDGLPASGGVWTFFNPARLRRGEAPSGLLYILLLVLLSMLALFLVVRFDAPQAKVSPLLIVRLTGLLLATAFGFGGLSLLLSAVTQNRNAAMALTGAAMALLYVVPTVFAASLPLPNNAPLPYYFAALSPLSVTALFDPPQGVAPSDAITIILYTVVGAFCFLVAGRAYKATSRKVPQ